MGKLFNLFFKTALRPANTAGLYGTIMARAREPSFFSGFGLPDAPAPRFALLTLHMFLVMHRLKGEGKGGQRLSRALSEFMVADLDRSLREQGVGDVGVLKRMKVLVSSFYQQLEEYEAALASADEKDLLRALDRHLFAALDTDAGRCARAATYVRHQVNALAGQPFAAFETASMNFAGPIN